MILGERSTLRVSKNALALLFAQVWAKLLSLVLVAMVARYESAVGLGQYVLVLTVTALAGVVSDFGLNVFLTREVARVGHARRQRELLGMVLPLKIGLSLVGLTSLIVLASVIPLPQATKQLLPVAALLMLPEAAVGAARSFVNGRQRMDVSGGVDMFSRLLAVGASFPALLAGYGVAGVLVSSIGASLASLALYGFVLWRWTALPLWCWSVSDWRACLAESYPFALTSLAAMLYARVDLVLLGLWQGEVAAGLYGAAYRLWETVGLLPASLLDAMFPELSRLASSQEGRSKLCSLFRVASRGMLIGGLLLAAAGVLVAGTLISLVYGTASEYAPVELPFRLLVSAVPALFIYLLSGHTLYALRRQHQVTVAMLTVGFVNIGLNLFAIPRWGSVGAAAVALFSEWLLAGSLYLLARRALVALKPTSYAPEL